MKRGLVVLEETARAEDEARVEALRGALRARGIAFALVYGDVSRSDDINYLTNLCIYWNEGVIAVPVDGVPALLAKLSKRVHPWMERTSILTDLRASQKLPALIGDYLRANGSGTVAFVDSTWWPAQLVDDIVAAAPDHDFIDLCDAVRRERMVPDELDRSDLERAGALVALGLSAAAAAEGEPTARIAALELAARGGGARDVLASCFETSSGVQIDCTVQYANVWARGARVLGGGSELRAGAEAAADRLSAGTTVADLSAVVAAEASVAVIRHTDLATGGDLRQFAGGVEPLAEGQVVTLTVSSGGVAVADTFVIGGDHAEPITQTTAEVSA